MPAEDDRQNVPGHRVVRMHAWAAGAAATVDTFAPDWDFWGYVEEPLAVLRERWSIPAAGLDAAR
jgi:hypothetical protein